MFCNASLQIFLHLNIFLEKFLKKISESEFNNNAISYQLYLIILDMYNSKFNYLDITNFLYNFGKKHSNYDGYMQQDAIEFFRILLDELSIECNEIKNVPKYKEIIYTNNSSKIK